MAYTDKQIAWLETAQSKAADFAADTDAATAKAEKLKDVIAQLDADKEAIRAAQNFEIALARNTSIFRLPGKGKMSWMTGDMATEVDTYADISRETQVDPEDLKTLNTAFSKILQRQEDMLGSGLFTKEDVARELWTPLVREGIIPSNIVPDAYSDFKKMFEGAAGIYEEKLADHSAGTSKYQAVFEGIGIAKESVSLLGSIASAGITYGNFEVAAISRAETREIVAKQEVLGAKQDATIDAARSGLGLAQEASVVDVLKAASENDQYKHLVNEYNNIDATLNSLSDQLFSDPRWVAEQRTLLAASTGVLNGGLTLATQGVQFGENFKSEKKNGHAVDSTLKFASNAADTIANDVVGKILSAASVSNRQRGEDGGTWQNQQGFASGQAVLGALIQGNRLAEKVLLATQAKTPAEREKAIMTIVASLGDTLAAAAKTTTQTSGTISSGAADEEITSQSNEATKSRERPGEWANHAGISNLAAEGIRGLFILGADVKLAQKALTKKPEPDFQSFAAAITVGLSHIGTASATGAGQDSFYKKEDLLTDSEVEDLSNKSVDELIAHRFELSGSPLTRTEGEQAVAHFGHAGHFADVNAAIKSMVAGLQGAVKESDGGDAIRKNTQAALDKIEQEKTASALKDLQKKLLDKGEREAFMADIEARADVENQRLNDLIEAAEQPADPDDKAAVEKAMKAVDALIADLKASEMKLKLVQTIAAGGTKVLTRIFPVTGFADAVRQLAVDTLALAKKSAEVDKWRKNAALASNSNSIYATAINERLYNASVQVSQKTFNSVFSILGVASEGARLGDATGVATGISTTTSLAKALTDYGYKMHDRIRVANGWKTYLEARANPANRKAARAAISGNSTLAKCVLAYGIVEAKDPIARQVGRNCGLTPEVLASSTDVCKKVVQYFETLYSDDPVVLRRVPKSEKWHPGTPDLTLKSWLKFKRAATDKAYPRLAKESRLTPEIDAPIKALHNLCNGDPFNYPSVRDTLAPKDAATFAQDVKPQLDALSKALKDYRPVNSEPDNPEDQKWIGGQPHHEMRAVADAMEAQVTLILREVDLDMKMQNPTG